MILQCGYIPGTDSQCYHPVQNVEFWGSEWTVCKVILNGSIIGTINNLKEIINVSIVPNQKLHSIDLQVNQKKIYGDPQLYYVNLEFDGNPEYKLFKSMIVDH